MQGREGCLPYLKDPSGQSDFLYAVVVAIGELKARSEVINQKKSRKRILLISNFLMDLSNMDDALEFARGVSGALTDAGITLEVCHACGSCCRRPAVAGS